MLSMLILIVLVAVPITLITGNSGAITVYYPDKTSVFSYWPHCVLSHFSSVFV